MNIYMDSEFTGLKQNTTLLSLGLVSEDNRVFYAEFTDFDRKQLNDWIISNVLNNLLFKNRDPFFEQTPHDLGSSYFIKGNSDEICAKLISWLKQFTAVTIVSDCLAYDWVLFCELFGGAQFLPSNVYYIPMDICTMFDLKGIDPDVNRERFIHNEIIDVNDLKLSASMCTALGSKHNSLWDALVIKTCYDKIKLPSDGYITGKISLVKKLKNWLWRKL